MASRLANVRQQLPYLPRTLGLIWAAAQGWFILWIALLVVQGLLPVAVVYLTRTVVDELAHVLGSAFSWEAMRPLVLDCTLMAAVLTLGQILATAVERVRTVQHEYLSDHIRALVYRKAVEVDLRQHDLVSFHDRLYRAQTEAEIRPAWLVDNAGNLIQHGLTLIAMAAVIAPYGMWLPVVLVLSTLPTLIVFLRYSTKRYRWEQEHTPDARRLKHYHEILLGRPHAAEIRLLGLGQHFIALHQALRGRHRRAWLAFEARESLASLFAGLAGAVGAAGALAWIIWKVVNGHGTLGDVALFQQAFSRGQALLRALLTSVGGVYRNMLFLSDLFAFLALRPAIVDPRSPLAAPRQVTKGIRCRSLTYRYPGADAPVFDDLDIDLPAGKVTALVGVNGVGKSTLLKLLCRLYEPEAGSIEIDGIDIRRFRVADLRRRFALLFQETPRYHESARDTVALGEVDVGQRDGAVEAACASARIDDVITAWPAGYDTPLGKLFAGGEELSGGQWRRIALARTLVRDVPILLLDEPTSGMDSWAEAEWMKHLRTQVAHRTTILVTHRFSTAARADQILVLHHGRILEAGTHEELLAARGRYAQAWTEQLYASLPPGGG